MAKINILVDTDILIDYFNEGLFSNILENKRFNIYYSAITRKELLSKTGLKTSDREAILYTLKGYRKVRLNERITRKYSEIRKQYPHIDKEDALIAATALLKGLPLMTRNLKHFKKIKGLLLIGRL